MSFAQTPLTDSDIHNAVSLWISNPSAPEFTNTNNTPYYSTISNWDTSQVTDMSYLFDSEYYFNDDITSWDTSSVTDISYMFQYAISFNQNIGNWNTGNVITMEGTFKGAYNFNQDIGS